jgi:hypothetical protein
MNARGDITDSSTGIGTGRFISSRHAATSGFRRYPHTHVDIDLDAGVRRALQLQAFMEGVRYKRYERE